MSFHAKIIEAAKEAGYVEKSSRNTQQGYNFAGDEAITAKFREAMLKQGVLVYPDNLEFSQIQTIPREGKDTPNVLVSITGTLVASDGEGELRVASLGQGIDVGDKAVYKALTGFKKYGYRMLVMMVTGDDPEKDEKPTTRVPRVAAKPAGESPATKARRDEVKALADSFGITTDELKVLRGRVTDKEKATDLTNADIDKLLEEVKKAGELKKVTGGEIV